MLPIYVLGFTLQLPTVGYERQQTVWGLVEECRSLVHDISPVADRQNWHL